MMEEDKTSNVLHQDFTNTGRLRSEIVISQNKSVEYLAPGQVLVPKWIVLVSGVVAAVVIVNFVAAFAVVYTAPRPGLYNESCYKRSCVPHLNLKCLNSTCLCYEYQYYSNKCENKSDYMQHCSRVSQCVEESMICRDGVCKCNSTSYWNKTCIQRSYYQKYCSTDNECRVDLMLTCNSASKKCLCSSNRYWDGEVCTLKRTINETCTNTNECIATNNLKCIGGICKCDPSNEFWNNNYNVCLKRYFENEACSSSIECYSPMVCNNSICHCTPYQYFNATILNCVSQNLNGVQCNSTLNCRSDLGLICLNQICQCNSTLPLWSTSRLQCILPKSYSEVTCQYHTDCDATAGLQCNINAGYLVSPCNCPLTSVVGMCDCFRVSGNETYWNGSSCVPALAYNSSCLNASNSFVCKSATEGTLCNSSTTNYLCECPPLKYYDNTKCKPKVLESIACSLGTECREDLGLSCQSGFCKCNSTYQYWSSGSTSCMNYKTYNQGCSPNNCDPNQHLICKTSLNSACNCPLTSANSLCDCVSEINNETYWNNSQCVPALSYGVACAGPTFSYTCQQKTQITICNSSTGTSLCECAPLFYYNGVKCLAQVLNGVACPLTIECRNDLGLICQSGFCKCNSTYQYWSSGSTSCMNYKTYNQGCSSATCNPNEHLICKTSSNSACNCPLASANNLCDCVSEINNETYWNNSQCVPALGYGVACAGPTFSYTCKQKTQITICNSSTGTSLCECAPLFYYNGIKCLAQVLNGVACPLTIECRTDLGLICQSGTCSCNSTYQYWNLAFSTCQNYKTYTELCLFDYYCDPSLNLWCKTAARAACNCPTTSALFACDCVSEVNNETYWNGIQCTPAIDRGQPCANSASSYTCKQKTQGTICNSSTGSFLCECAPYQYFNGISCQNQVLVNVACPLGIECRTDLGLICQSSTCVCPSTQVWSSLVTPNKCINYRTYTETCSVDSDCDTSLGLKCKIASDIACNCPEPSSNGKCDCVRATNNENYWDSTQCVPVSSLNGICSGDYMCPTLTISSTCISSSCSCGPNAAFNPTLNKCVQCAAGWTLLCLKCYYVGSTTTSNTDSSGSGTKTTAGCMGRSDAKMANPYNDTILQFLKDNDVPPGQYWVDAVFVSGTTYQSRDGSWTVPSGSWCSGPNGDDLVYWDSSSECFGDASNTGGVSKFYFCEYTPT